MSLQDLQIVPNKSGASETLLVGLRSGGRHRTKISPRTSGANRRTGDSSTLCASTYACTSSLLSRSSSIRDDKCVISSSKRRCSSTGPDINWLSRVASLSEGTSFVPMRCANGDFVTSCIRPCDAQTRQGLHESESVIQLVKSLSNSWAP